MTSSSVPNVRGAIVIPARLASTRLPNKLLLAETGRPLLAHVIDRAREAIRLAPSLFTDVLVAVDESSLLSIAQRSGVRAVMTGSHHRCGTTRIAEALEQWNRADIDFVVNVQGDEPELAPEAIVRVAETLLADSSADMATLVVAMAAGTDALKANPNAVKAVLDDQGRAIYFSRAPVPYDRHAPRPGEPLWYHHLGIYAYRREFLAEFASMPACGLEEREGLEQLRALNAGRRIRAAVVPHEWAGKGIDTREDYEAFVGRFAA